MARSHPKPAVQTLARTLAMTGCRVSEALGIRACDVDLEANEVRIATLKRRRTHWQSIPVPEDLVYALELVHRVRRAQGSARGANRRLWPITRQTANRQVGALMRSAGIEGPQACARGLRHSYGVAAVTAGVPLPTVAAVLGHASLTTTAIYTTAIGAEARELVSRIWTQDRTRTRRHDMAASRSEALARGRATYQDVLDASAHQVAEIVDGMLHTHPRPA